MIPLAAAYILAALGQTSHAQQTPGTSSAGPPQQSGPAGSAGAQSPAPANPVKEDAIDNPILEQADEERNITYMESHVAFKYRHDESMGARAGLLGLFGPCGAAACISWRVTDNSKLAACVCWRNRETLDPIVTAQFAPFLHFPITILRPDFSRYSGRPGHFAQEPMPYFGLSNPGMRFWTLMWLIRNNYGQITSDMVKAWRTAHFVFDMGGTRYDSLKVNGRNVSPHLVPQVATLCWHTNGPGGVDTSKRWTPT